MHIVVVEDHSDLRDAFVEHLRGEGFDVFGAACAEELDEHMAVTRTQLLILDINLPGVTGLEIAERIRSSSPGIYILMLTARGAESDRIAGYESGADFYLVKPISPQELTAAVRAAQRRFDNQVHGHGSAVLLNLSSMTLHHNDAYIDLSKSDAAFMKALALAPERHLAYWRLFEVTERPMEDSSKSQLELQVFRLRKKFAEIGLSDKTIRSVRNDGYQLMLPITIID